MCYYVTVITNGIYYLYRANDSSITLVGDLDSASKFEYDDASSLADAYGGTVRPCS
jgi:hypothetical protein